MKEGKRQWEWPREVVSGHTISIKKLSAYNLSILPILSGSVYKQVKSSLFFACPLPWTQFITPQYPPQVDTSLCRNKTARVAGNQVHKALTTPNSYGSFPLFPPKQSLTSSFYKLEVYGSKFSDTVVITAAFLSIFFEGKSYRREIFLLPHSLLLGFYIHKNEYYFDQFYSPSKDIKTYFCLINLQTEWVSKYGRRNNENEPVFDQKKPPQDPKKKKPEPSPPKKPEQKPPRREGGREPREPRQPNQKIEILSRLCKV